MDEIAAALIAGQAYHVRWKASYVVYVNHRDYLRLKYGGHAFRSRKTARTTWGRRR